MQRRISRTFLVFTALTLLLAGFFLSSHDVNTLTSFRPPSGVERLLPQKKPPQSPVTSSQTPLGSPEVPITPARPDANTADPQTSGLPILEATPAPSKPEPTSTLPPFSTSPPHVLSHAPGSKNTSYDISKASSGTLLVEITETNGWHDEVVAALVHPLGSLKNVRLNLYQKNSRYGILDIMQNFSLSHDLPPSRSPDEFRDAPESNVHPDIVVATTCETDVIYLATRFNALLEKGRTFLYCVVHHGDRWQSEELQEVISPWVKKGLIDFVTLSPHTATFLRKEGLDKWSIEIPQPIKHFAPVFPVELPPQTGTGEIGGKDELAFALQGNYEPTRRDFDGIFTSLESFIGESNERSKQDAESNVTLHLLGSGPRPVVPDSVKDHVYFDEGLSYLDFYSILSQTFALLPAFANDDYLDRKASSSVPASLLGGTPLVATQEILKSYTYLPKEAVYLRQDGETELDVIRRVLKGKAKRRRAKMMTVRKACSKLVKENVQLFEGWVKEATQRIAGQ